MGALFINLRRAFNLIFVLVIFLFVLFLFLFLFLVYLLHSLELALLFGQTFLILAVLSILMNLLERIGINDDVFYRMIRHFLFMFFFMLLQLLNILYLFI